MITGSIGTSLAGMTAFLSYFGTSVLLVMLFLVLYGRATPYREFGLIAEGNLAASLSYGGALLGFAFPLSSAISHSVSLVDMVVWGIVALVVQVLTFLVVRLSMPRIVSDIPDNKVATGCFLGIVSVATGMINAACMTY
jgi:putative membrane protein